MNLYDKLHSCSEPMIACDCITLGEAIAEAEQEVSDIKNDVGLRNPFFNKEEALEKAQENLERLQNLEDKIHDPLSVRIDIPKDLPGGLPSKDSGTVNVSLAFILNKWAGMRMASGRFPYDDISALCKALAAKSFLNRHEIIGLVFSRGVQHVIIHVDEHRIKKAEFVAAIEILSKRNIDVSMLRLKILDCIE